MICDTVNFTPNFTPAYQIHGTNGEIAKINSAKFSIFGAVNRENKFEKICARKVINTK